MILALTNNINFKRKDLGYLRPRAAYHLECIERKMEEGTVYEGNKVKRLTKLTAFKTGNAFQYDLDKGRGTITITEPPVELVFNRKGDVLAIKRQNFLLRLKNFLLGNSKYLWIKQQKAINIAGRALKDIDFFANTPTQVKKTFAEATLTPIKRR